MWYGRSGKRECASGSCRDSGTVTQSLNRMPMPGLSADIPVKISRSSHANLFYNVSKICEECQRNGRRVRGRIRGRLVPASL